MSYNYFWSFNFYKHKQIFWITQLRHFHQIFSFHRSFKRLQAIKKSILAVHTSQLHNLYIIPFDRALNFYFSQLLSGTSARFVGAIEACARSKKSRCRWVGPCHATMSHRKSADNRADVYTRASEIIITSVRACEATLMIKFTLDYSYTPQVPRTIRLYSFGERLN